MITSKELRVTGTDHTITYVITRDPNVGTLQYAERDLLTNLSAMGDNEFTQQEIDEGEWLSDILDEVRTRFWLWLNYAIVCIKCLRGFSVVFRKAANIDCSHSVTVF